MITIGYTRYGAFDTEEFGSFKEAERLVRFCSDEGLYSFYGATDEYGNVYHIKNDGFSLGRDNFDPQRILKWNAKKKNK